MSERTVRVRVGPTLHLLRSGNDDDAFFEREIAKIIKALRSDGPAAEFENGTRVWVEDREIVDLTQKGSAQYTWDKAGNKVRCQRIRVTHDKGKPPSIEMLGFVYRKFE
jgi:hypothetical protein